jgi:ribonuclease P protein component
MVPNLNFGTFYFILFVAKQFTLGKNGRLKSRKQIEQLFSEGKSFPLSPFRIYYLVMPVITNSSTLQYGAGVSGKNFKRAVDRNRVKRLTREAYRLQKKQLQEATMQKKLQLSIFFIYTGKELPAFNIVREKVNVILNKLTKIVNENNSPDT